MATDPGSLVRDLLVTASALAAGVLAVLGAGYALYVALVLRWVDCANEAWSECSTPGLVQLVIAALGVLPALVMLALAVFGRGRPWRWFLVTALVYAAWVVYATQAVTAG